ISSRRRHTRFSRDWSSDVCSSDLSVWAWRAGRAATIGRSADLVLCLFPMEPPIYAAHGVDARFVGHPMADAMPLDPDRAAARQGFGLPMHAQVLAVLPGSRLGEVARMGPAFLEAAARVRASVPGLEILAPAANPGCRALLERQVAARPVAGLRLVDGQAREAMVAADVVLLASG